MYGVSVNTHGSASFWPCGRYTVALSLTPSRRGIFTPHWKSTGPALSAAGAGAGAGAGAVSAAAMLDRANRAAKTAMWRSVIEALSEVEPGRGIGREVERRRLASDQFTDQHAGCR